MKEIINATIETIYKKIDWKKNEKHVKIKKGGIA